MLVSGPVLIAAFEGLRDDNDLGHGVVGTGAGEAGVVEFVADDTNVGGAAAVEKAFLGCALCSISSSVSRAGSYHNLIPITLSAIGANSVGVTFTRIGNPLSNIARSAL